MSSNTKYILLFLTILTIGCFISLGVCRVLATRWFEINWALINARGREFWWEPPRAHECEARRPFDGFIIIGVVLCLGPDGGSVHTNRIKINPRLDYYPPEFMLLTHNGPTRMGDKLKEKTCTFVSACYCKSVPRNLRYLNLKIFYLCGISPFLRNERGSLKDKRVNSLLMLSHSQMLTQLKINGRLLTDL